MAAKLLNLLRLCREITGVRRHDFRDLRNDVPPPLSMSMHLAHTRHCFVF